MRSHHSHTNERANVVRHRAFGERRPPHSAQFESVRHVNRLRATTFPARARVVTLQCDLHTPPPPLWSGYPHRAPPTGPHHRKLFKKKLFRCRSAARRVRVIREIRNSSGSVCCSVLDLGDDYAPTTNRSGVKCGVDWRCFPHG